MRYLILSLMLLLFSTNSFAITIEDERDYGISKPNPDLKILSSTDVELFQSVLEAFVTKNPSVNIKYQVASTKDIFETVKNKQQGYDLIMSSAMDLQMKLANDGIGQPLVLPPNIRVPDWSKWQNTLFGFSLEPIGMVVSRENPIMSNIPNNRRSLVAFLRENASVLRGKIVTYDVSSSGAGFLFATQDERQSNSYWRMAEVMGSLNASLYCCSGEMLDAVKTGDALIAYNIIGPYAEKRAQKEKVLKVVYFQDYTHMLMRTALIPKNAAHPETASLFLQFILSEDGQNFIENSTEMLSLSSTLLNENRNFKPIRLDTGLLVYLDKFKKERFLEDWQEALIQ